MHEPNVPVIEALPADGPPVFRTLVETHKRSVYALALDLTGNHHDAEDLSQEVFIKAYRGLDGFRGEASVGTWLRRIAVNTYLNKRRKKSLSFMRFFEDVNQPDGPLSGRPSPERDAAGEGIRDHIGAALNRLSPRERTAFVLRHDRDLGVREVAEAMEVAEGTVKSLLYRATQKLRVALAFYKDELGIS